MIRGNDRKPSPTPASTTDSASTSPPRAEDAEAVTLIGGSVRMAAESARRGGFRVIGVDLFADTDTLAACGQHVLLGDGERALTAIERLPPTPLVVVGGLIDKDDLVLRLCQRHRLLGPSLSTSYQLRQPSHLLSLAHGTGLSIPASYPPGQPPPASGPIRWLWKRRDCSGGLGVEWASKEHDTSASQSSGGYLQQYVPGRPYGATFLGDGSSAHLLGVCRLAFTRRANGRLPFVYCGVFGPVPLPDSILEPLQVLGDRVVKHHQLRGLFNADLIVDHGGHPWLLEINARWSGSSEIVEACYREQPHVLPRDSLFRLHWEFLRGSRLGNEREPLTRLPAGIASADTAYARWWKRVVFSVRGGRFHGEVLQSIDQPATAAGVVRFTDIPRDGQWIGRGDPIVTIQWRCDHDSGLEAKRQCSLIRAVHGAVR